MGKNILGIWVFLFYAKIICSQNLVANGSFENVTSEPYYGCEFTNAIGWMNPCGSTCFGSGGTPDLYSTFCTGQAVLPNSFMGYTNPHTGNRIAAFVTYHLQLADYREYISTQLSSPLVPGNTYTVSFWETGGNPVQYYYRSNNLAVYFSTSALTQSGYNVISGVTPQFKLTNLVADTVWTQYSFTFVPTQPFNYITLGNFDNDLNTQIFLFGTNRPYAYYFVDDISVVGDSCVPPLVHLGNDTSVCLPDTLTFDATSAAATYLWSNGATSSTIRAYQTGEYLVTVSVAGCSTTDSIHLTLNPKPPVSVTANQANICPGDSSQICATAGLATYNWNTGATTACIVTNLSGNYYVTISDHNGCTAVSNQLTVTVFPFPPVSISVNGDTLTSYNAITYQWYLNGSPIPGATSQTYIAAIGGTYTVLVTDSNGCTENSNPVVISGITPLSPGEGSGVRIYPNPNSAGSWQLEIGNNLLGATIEIYNEQGALLLTTNIKHQMSNLELNCAKGIYLLHLQNKDVNIYRKLVRL